MTLSGALFVDKPIGRTSYSVVDFVKRQLKQSKIGHCGTLDPFASGLLILLVGRNFTRLQDKVMHGEKEYLATVHLGKKTTTFDREGEVVLTSDVIPSLQEVKKAINHFTGKVQQIPPMYSARKVGGKRLYELARKGQEVERKSTEVEIFPTLIRYEYPIIEVTVRCSKGTYIRSLADDIGVYLNTYAYVEELRRTASYPITIDHALSWNELSDNNRLIEAIEHHTSLFESSVQGGYIKKHEELLLNSF